MRCQRTESSLAATHLLAAAPDAPPVSPTTRNACCSSRRRRQVFDARFSRCLWPSTSSPSARSSTPGGAPPTLPRHDLTALLQSPVRVPHRTRSSERSVAALPAHGKSIGQSFSGTGHSQPLQEAAASKLHLPPPAASHGRDTWLPTRCRTRPPCVQLPDPDPAAHLCPRFWGRMSC